MGISRAIGVESSGTTKHMKRHGYLYDDICSMDNLREAHKRASRGKRHYREVIMVDSNPDEYLEQIREMLVKKTFKNSPYITMTRNEYGKVREISKLPYFPDRIIHHAIMNVVEPIWESQLIADTWASIKGRGVHKGVRRIKSAMQDVRNTQYCLKLDVRKFYPSIDNEIIKRIIRIKIKDVNLLWLLDEIIDSSKGLPIGNYLSQILANLYLSTLDHWVKESLGVKYYFRYCDDMVLLARDKQSLHEIRLSIGSYLTNELNLSLKSNWQVFPVDVRGVDFLGYRFFHGYTLVRKSIVQRFKLKSKKNKRESIPSYWGWFKWADSFNLINKYGVNYG